MNSPRHHIPDPMMIAYVAGAIEYPYAVVLASHISMCDECRARYEAHTQIGGMMMEDAATEELSDGVFERVLAELDKPYSAPPRPQPMGIYPVPLSQIMAGHNPAWRRVGMGIKQSILWNLPEGSLRLLWIPAGQAVSDHGHNGLELTLVLQGSFADAGGRFAKGDLEIADATDIHTPVAGPDEDCICLAATNAPLKFTGLIPRMLQPFLNI